MDNPNLDFDPEADKNEKPEVSPELEGILSSLNKLTIVATRIADDVRNSSNRNNGNPNPSKKNQKKPKKDDQSKPKPQPKTDSGEQRRKESKRQREEEDRRRREEAELEEAERQRQAQEDAAQNQSLFNKKFDRYLTLYRNFPRVLTDIQSSFDEIKLQSGPNNQILEKLGDTLNRVTDTLKDSWREIAATISAKYLMQSAVQNSIDYGDISNKFGALGTEGNYDTTAGVFGRMVGSMSDRGFGGSLELVSGEMSRMGRELGETTDTMAGVAKELGSQARFHSTNQLIDTTHSIGQIAKTTGQSMDSIRDYYVENQRDFGKSVEDTTKEFWQMVGDRDKVLGSLQRELKIQKDSGKLTEAEYQLELDKLTTQQEYYDGLMEITKELHQQGASMSGLSKTYATNLKYMHQMGYAGKQAVENAKKLTAALRDYKGADETTKVMGGKSISDQLRNQYMGMSRDDIAKSLTEKGLTQGTSFAGKEGELANLLASNNKNDRALVYEELFEKIGGDDKLTSQLGLKSNEKVSQALKVSGINSLLESRGKDNVSYDNINEGNVSMFAQQMGMDQDRARDMLATLQKNGWDVDKYQKEQDATAATDTDVTKSKEGSQKHIQTKSTEHWLTNITDYVGTVKDTLLAQTPILAGILAALIAFKARALKDGLKKVYNIYRGLGGDEGDAGGGGGGNGGGGGADDAGGSDDAGDDSTRRRRRRRNTPSARRSRSMKFRAKKLFRNMRRNGIKGNLKNLGNLLTSEGATNIIDALPLPQTLKNVVGSGSILSGASELLGSGRSVASTAAKGLKGFGKAIPFLGTAFTAYDQYDKHKDDKSSTTDKILKMGSGIGGTLAGASAGASMGGAAGAALGSVVPVIGNAVGAAVGTAAGAIIGAYLGEEAGDILGDWLTKTKDSLMDGVSDAGTYISDKFTDAGDWVSSLFGDDSKKPEETTASVTTTPVEAPDLDKILSPLILTPEDILKATSPQMAASSQLADSAKPNPRVVSESETHLNNGESAAGDSKTKGSVRSLNSANGKLVIEIPNFGSNLNQYNKEQEQYSWWKLW
ncbi:hypothetical protein [Yersinia ruckeri]|uniref:hypothetical protein n=1 Tax=Yersinia ruckeri TaxID=29486 RepID=UPI0022384619|nr:hypothetical protein [Yersinia ruckeri]MCW6598634.1 hypothetical protein [Yersinia ruckeri]